MGKASKSKRGGASSLPSLFSRLMTKMCSPMTSDTNGGSSNSARLPVVDLFRNCKVEIQFTLLELKRLFEVFNLSLITHAH